MGMLKSALGERLLVPHRARWIEPDMPLPPDNWMDTGFDDSSWTRVPGILVWGGKRYEKKLKKSADNRSSFLAPIFKRGKFEIKDPSLVKDLKLTIEYRGFGRRSGCQRDQSAKMKTYPVQAVWNVTLDSKDSKTMDVTTFAAASGEAPIFSKGDSYAF